MNKRDFRTFRTASIRESGEKTHLVKGCASLVVTPDKNL